MKTLEWLKVYNSPFKLFLPQVYVGKTAIGCPWFLPRKWVSGKSGSFQFVPLKVGFSFCGLGFKTKWSSIDFRHEWNPVWSFVFFGYQIALTFMPENDSQYWECFLYYHFETDKTKSWRERVEQGKREFPQVWTQYSKDVEEKIDYWELVVNDKYRTNYKNKQ